MLDPRNRRLSKYKQHLSKNYENELKAKYWSQKYPQYTLTNKTNSYPHYEDRKFWCFIETTLVNKHPQPFLKIILDKCCFGFESLNYFLLFNYINNYN